MNAQLDFVPEWCPQCGQEIRIIGHLVSEYFGGTAWICPNCSCRIKYVRPVAETQSTVDHWQRGDLSLDARILGDGMYAISVASFRTGQIVLIPLEDVRRVTDALYPLEAALTCAMMEQKMGEQNNVPLV